MSLPECIVRGSGWKLKKRKTRHDDEISYRPEYIRSRSTKNRKSTNTGQWKKSGFMSGRFL